MCRLDYLLGPGRWNPQATGARLWEYSQPHTLLLLKFQSRWVTVKLSAVDTVPEQQQFQFQCAVQGGITQLTRVLALLPA